MKRSSPLYSSVTCHWATPRALYARLDREFQFTDDPCPLGGAEGLERPWGRRVFLNPPYGRKINLWLYKALGELERGTELVAALLPTRTDTIWFHDLVLARADEVRFLRGRIHFNEGRGRAPFPSMIVVWRSLS